MTMQSLNAVDLHREAEHLHRCVFGFSSTLAFRTNYVEAHVALPDLNSATDREQKTVRKIVQMQLNASSIEPWLRNRNRRHLLTAKLMLVAYLAECDGSFHAFDRNANLAKRTLFLMAVKGGFCLVQGWYLKVRNGLL